MTTIHSEAKWHVNACICVYKCWACFGIKGLCLILNKKLIPSCLGREALPGHLRHECEWPFSWCVRTIFRHASVLYNSCVFVDSWMKSFCLETSTTRWPTPWAWPGLRSGKPSSRPRRTVSCFRFDSFGGCIFVGVYFMCLVFTRMPGDSYCRWFRSLCHCVRLLYVWCLLKACKVLLLLLPSFVPPFKTVLRLN